MPGPDPLDAPVVFALFAYGPAPGLELIPYFLALLAWVGLAVASILVSPITALIRRIRGTRGAAPPAAPNDAPNDPLQSAPEASGDASHGQS